MQQKIVHSHMTIGLFSKYVQLLAQLAIILLKDLKDKAIRNSKIFCILQKAPVEKFVLSLIVLSILGILTKLYISRCIMTARY